MLYPGVGTENTERRLPLSGRKPRGMIRLGGAGPALLDVIASGFLP